MTNRTILLTTYFIDRLIYQLHGLTMRPQTSGNIWQHECDGWNIYSKTNNAQKIADLRKISDFYHLNLTIEEVKP